MHKEEIELFERNTNKKIQCDRQRRLAKNMPHIPNIRIGKYETV